VGSGRAAADRSRSIATPRGGDPRGAAAWRTRWGGRGVSSKCCLQGTIGWSTVNKMRIMLYSGIRYKRFFGNGERPDSPEALRGTGQVILFKPHLIIQGEADGTAK